MRSGQAASLITLGIVIRNLMLIQGRLSLVHYFYFSHASVPCVVDTRLTANMSYIIFCYRLSIFSHFIIFTNINIYIFFFSFKIDCCFAVIFRPWYAAPQAGGFNFHPQAQAQAQGLYSAMFSPESSKMSTSNVFPTHDMSPKCCHNHASVSNADDRAEGRETLQLFPLHPANRRSVKRSESYLTSASASASHESSEEEEKEEEKAGSEHQFLIDFLGALNG